MDVSSLDSSAKVKKPDQNELEHLIQVIQRTLVQTLKEKIDHCRGDLNNEKILLFYASQNQQFLATEVVKLFIELGSNVNDQDEQGRTILHLTIIQDVGVIGDDGNLVADAASKLELIEYLVEKGADVSMTDDRGIDPLRMALISHQPEIIVSRLIDIIGVYDYSNASRNGQVLDGDAAMSPSQVLNRPDKAGFATLYHVLNVERYYDSKIFEIFEKLIELGADPNVVSSCTGISVFEYALEYPVRLDIPSLTLLIPTDAELVRAIKSRTKYPFDGIMDRFIKKDFSQVKSEIFEEFVDKLIAAGFDIAEENLLLHAMSRFIPLELVKVLLKKNVPIEVSDITGLFERHRFDAALFLLNTIYETDKDKVREIRTNHPGLVCQLLYDRDNLYPVVDLNIFEVMKVLLEKYELDVNYSDGKLFILHDLLTWTAGNEDFVLDYLFSKYPNLDIDKKVGWFSRSALEFALDRRSFYFATKLIRNSASVKKLRIPQPVLYNGFTECYQLLYQLGVDIKFTDHNQPSIQQEVDRFKDWIEVQKRNTNSSTLTTRKNVSSRTEDKKVTGIIGLPGGMLKMCSLDERYPRSINCGKDDHDYDQEGPSYQEGIYDCDDDQNSCFEFD